MDLSQEFTSAEGLKQKQDRAKQSIRLLMVFLDENVQFFKFITELKINFGDEKWLLHVMNPGVY